MSGPAAESEEKQEPAPAEDMHMASIVSAMREQREQREQVVSADEMHVTISGEIQNNRLS